MVGIFSWNMILISNDFWHKRKMYNFDSYNVLYAVMTVLQGHVVLFTCDCRYFYHAILSKCFFFDFIINIKPSPSMETLNFFCLLK